MGGQFLKDIVEYKRELLASKKDYYDAMKEAPMPSSWSGVFRDAISISGQLNLIAEIKKASPSRGIIREYFDPVTIAQIYRECGAAAVSVLTEDKYFLGKTEYIEQICPNIDIPILTKDFIIDDRQIYEAKSFGADAVLLIVAILEGALLKNLIKISSTLGVDCLVEVHDEDEMKKALDAGAQIIGINNRDLKTFHVDIQTVEQLVPKIPKDIVSVAESGYTKHKEILALKELGVNAVLMGEVFMSERDIGAKVKEVMNGQS